MSTDSGANYLKYATDSDHMSTYAQYQERYADQIRESDRVLVELVREAISQVSDEDAPTRLLDVGCSTGNLLLHLKRSGLRLDLSGVDLAADVIKGCQSNADLDDISFGVLDVVADEPDGTFDLITVNATFFAMDAPDFEAAVKNLSAAVTPDGAIICFDWFHPFEQEVSIIETSKAHPNGLKLVARSYTTVREAFGRSGLGEIDFQRFFMPFPLKRSTDPASIATHTVSTADGRNLSFRGTLFQPWCHATASRD